MEDAPLRAGQLDVRIAPNKSRPLDLQASLLTRGTLVERWSSADPLIGDERNVGAAVVAGAGKVQRQWSQAMLAFSPLDRWFSCRMPAPAGIPESIYDVISVLAKGRNVQIDILAAMSGSVKDIVGQPCGRTCSAMRSSAARRR